MQFFCDLGRKITFSKNLNLHPNIKKKPNLHNISKLDFEFAESGGNEP